MISDEKFGKDEHLLKTADFSKVYKRGVPHKSGGIILYCQPNALEKNRLGFSISSRNVKLATKRNRLRRFFKEIYRKNKKDLRSGFDMIIVVKRDFGSSLTFKEIKKHFLRLVKEAGLLT
ncbi:MAG: ribonuclease P protein component [Candidatus Omnitrophota bacterium]|nr:ribonuclease P protein component [Candidatus Omnitrophota bacterium]